MKSVFLVCSYLMTSYSKNIDMMGWGVVKANLGEICSLAGAISLQEEKRQACISALPIRKSY